MLGRRRLKLKRIVREVKMVINVSDQWSEGRVQ